MKSWVLIYHKFALLLKAFYIKNGEDSGEKFYELCNSDPVFFLLNQWSSRFRQDPEYRSFDPIHVFASFNDSKLSDKTRIKRLQLLFELLGDDEVLDEIGFTGCPTPFMMKIMATRTGKVQKEIWRFFNEVMGLGGRVMSVSEYPAYNEWYGINLTSISIFLFWVDYKHFLPLDSNTQFLLRSKSMMSRMPKNFADYIEFMVNIKLPDYLEFSILARLERPLPILVDRNKIRKTHHVIPMDDVIVGRLKELPLEPIQEEEIFNGGSRMIGLRVYDPTPDKWVKVLRRGKMYPFYRAFSFEDKELEYHPSNDSVIHYDSFRDVDLYRLNSKSVNISAVAGENGAGKSTLLDLAYLAINNLCADNPVIGADLEYVEGISLDFFFMTDALYKVTVRLGVVNVERYVKNGEVFSDPYPVSINKFELEQLFYTIAVNHSLYGMNSEQLGDWMIPLIEKNDAYQVPMVVNPYRDKGNIDVNKEAKLVRSRLLATLLQPFFLEEGQESSPNLRKLTQDRMAERITLELDYSAFTKKWKHKKSDISFSVELTDTYWQLLLEEICRRFEINIDFPLKALVLPIDFISAAFSYMVRKVVAICLNYSRYERFIAPKKYQIISSSIPALVDALFEDTSHVTHKFYQTVHFLKCEHFAEIRDSLNKDEKFSSVIDELALKIDRSRSLIGNKKLMVSHFIPPPFLKVEIFLSGDVPLAELSSGEKQRIFSVSSLGYHLINLDSNMDIDELNKYSYVNVVFDEVELYFHPEMQRSFIKYLLDYLNMLELETVFQLNILFVTHSPFILSDIPSDNILFLGDRVAPGIKTFGSNIHTLLVESFFMHEGFMGEFARGKINSMIDFLLKKAPSEVWNPENCAQVIALIGEPLIRERLVEIYRERYQAADVTDLRITALENEIKMLRREKNQL